MLQKISELSDIGSSSIRADKNQHNQEVRGVGEVSQMVKTLPKAKKSKKLGKSKNPELVKALDNAFGTDFLIFKAKTAFLHLQTSFTEILILHYFDSKSHIWIETDTLRYAISEILNQLTSDQNFFDHVIDKNPNFFKFG